MFCNYVIDNENSNEIVKEFKVGERVDSDHMPLIVEIVEDEGNKGKEEEEEEEERRTRLRWDEKAIEIYKKNTEKRTDKGGEVGEIEGTIEKRWDRLKKLIEKDG